MGLMRDILFGREGGLALEDLRLATHRNKFSDFLPYRAYDDETRLYINTDETIGFIWECDPLTYAGTDVFDTLKGLMSMGFPENTVLQFMNYADPYIAPDLDRYLATKKISTELIDKATESILDFFHKGRHGIDKLSGIPVRRFRLFVSIKFPADAFRIDTNQNDSSQYHNSELLEFRDSIGEVLRGARLHPTYLHPEGLIRFLGRIFNERTLHEVQDVYDDTYPIRKQIIMADTKIESKWSQFMIRDMAWKCCTPKKLPQEVNELLMNILCGDIWGVVSDTNQIQTPFFITVNVVFQNLRGALHNKCNFVLQQKAAGSFAKSLVRKQEEYTWATAEIESGTPFVLVVPMVWISGFTETQAREGITRAKRLWESKGFVMQEEKGILKIMFISGIPFGLYAVGRNLEDMDRSWILHTEAAVRLLPVQGDFAGGLSAVNMFIGRKGQIVPFDLFDKCANNNNLFIAAESGSGKSFVTNFLVLNQLKSGGFIRLIDIGGSYRKMCKMFGSDIGAKYIQFNKNSGICLNPFTNVREIDEDIAVLSSIVGQMIFSSTKTVPDESEMSLIKNACRYAWDKYQTEANIDRVSEYLETFPKYASKIGITDDESGAMRELQALSRNLAFNLTDFLTTGVYGKWFNGKATLDISQDRFVVLELEELKASPELFKVVTLQILNYVTQDLYLTADRSVRRLILFDEAWQFLSGGDSGQGDMLKQVIESGYRRSRKYGGGFGVITQNVIDIRQFGEVGNVIFSNSAFKFYLQSSTYEKAQADKIIDYHPFVLDILKSVKSARPKYSEIFIDSPLGVGVVRLVVPPFLYYMFTTDADESAHIESLVHRGMTYAQAIESMVGGRA